MKPMRSFSKYRRHAPRSRLLGALLLAPALLALAGCNFAAWAHDAARDGDFPAVQKILRDHPAVIASTDAAGDTLLHHAASVGHKDMAVYLLDKNAPVDAKDDDGDTPLRFAAAQGHENVAALLLAHHADVNARDNRGSTPLHHAAWGQKSVVELLLSHQADANAHAANGDTPLRLALAKGYTDIAEILRQHGARE
jgi:ankyrin repeat protein